MGLRHGWGPMRPNGASRRRLRLNWRSSPQVTCRVSGTVFIRLTRGHRACLRWSARRRSFTQNWALRPRCAGACSCSLARSGRLRMPGRRCNRAKGIRDRSRGICYGTIRDRLSVLSRREAARPEWSVSLVSLVTCEDLAPTIAVPPVRKGCAMLNRRDLLLGTAAASIVPPLSLLTGARAQAQAVDLLKVFVPAAPGGGWDQTARTIEQVLRATSAVRGVQITNVGGAGGAVGLPQFLNSWRGQGNALMVAGMVMVGSLIANKSPVKLATATPIARLTGEFL